MRKLFSLMAVVAAFGLLGVSASGAAATEGTVNVGPQPNAGPVQGGCHEGLICIWTGANYSGQLSYWSEGDYGCKTHEAFHTFYSFYEFGHNGSAVFGSAGRYHGFSGNATPGATTGDVCISGA